jgi:hypothetical protein
MAPSNEENLLSHSRAWPRLWMYFSPMTIAVAAKTGIDRRLAHLNQAQNSRSAPVAKNAPIVAARLPAIRPIPKLAKIIMQSALRMRLALEVLVGLARG